MEYMEYLLPFIIFGPIALYGWAMANSEPDDY